MRKSMSRTGAVSHGATVDVKSYISINPSLTGHVQGLAFSFLFCP